MTLEERIEALKQDVDKKRRDAAAQIVDADEQTLIAFAQDESQPLRARLARERLMWLREEEEGETR